MLERVSKFRLDDLSPMLFANETCEHLRAQAEALIAELQPHVRITVRATTRVKDTLLWKRVFTWVEYAQIGHRELSDLLKVAPPAWDDRMIGVIRAAEARLSIDAGECVSTAQLALLAGVSHIQIGNFVRAKRLKYTSQDSGGYLFTASVAREFLIDRCVRGFRDPTVRKMAAY